MNKIALSSDKWPVLSLEAVIVPASSSCQTHLSCQRSSPFVDLEHGQHGEGAVGILCQAAIANLGKAPETFEGKEGVLDLGAHTGLAPIRGLVCLGQRAVPVGAFIGEVFCFRCNLPEPRPLRLASIGAVAVEAGFVAMQQVRHFMAVMDVGGGNARAVNQPRLAVRANVQLHAEVPVVAFLGLVHFGVAFLVLVLDRG